MQLIWYEPDDTAHILMQSDGAPKVEGADITLLREQGTGAPQIRDKTESGPYQHGATLLLQRLRPRQIKLRFELHHPDGPDEIAKARREFARWFHANPKVADAKGRLRWVTDVTREIEARIIGGMDFDWQWLDPRDIEMEVVLLADDPLWYDPTQRMESWSFTRSLTIVGPVQYPMRVNAEDEVNALSQVTNSGDWEAYPTIVWTGPASDIVVHNKTTDEQLALPGVDIAAGEQVVFDLTPGAKRVYGPGESNLLSSLAKPTSLATWHLAAAPEASAGANNVLLNAHSTSADTAVVMTWYDLYWTA